MNSISQKMFQAVIAYAVPVKIQETCILTDECPRHGDACPTGRAHCKACGTKLHDGFCMNQLCMKSYESRQTTRV